MSQLRSTTTRMTLELPTLALLALAAAASWLTTMMDAGMRADSMMTPMTLGPFLLAWAFDDGSDDAPGGHASGAALPARGRRGASRADGVLRPRLPRGMGAPRLRRPDLSGPSGRWTAAVRGSGGRGTTCCGAASPRAGGYPQDYATPQASAHDLGDSYERNLAGLIGFNPVFPGLRRALGPDVEVEQPIMWPGPEIEMHRAGLREWGDSEQWVRIKLDMAGTTHVTNRGHEITDQQAAQLLGISERAFARGYELAGTGLRAGEAAMNPADHTDPYEVVEARSPNQRLAAAQSRDIHQPASHAVDAPRR